MSFNTNLKSSDILKEAVDKVKKRILKDLQKAALTLGKGAVKKASHLAEEKLSGRLASVYKENLYMEQVSDNIVIVGLNEKAAFIEQDSPGGFMDYLLKGPKAKTAKDGTKYNVIPFEHDTKKNASNESKNEIAMEVKSFLKSQGMPHSKTRSLEKNEDGSPRIGKISEFSTDSMRGKGKKGVKELSKNLQGIQVHQNMNEKTGKVERNILTFRIISEKHRGNKWMYPSRKGVKIIKEVHDWVEDTWNKELLPGLQSKYN